MSKKAISILVLTVITTLTFAQKHNVVNASIALRNEEYADAKKYIDWFKTAEVKELINNFKAKGKQLFYYNYN